MTASRMRVGAAATALLLAATALAVDRGDFAWQWPLDTGGHDGLLALTLADEVYPRLLRDDLGDLVVFNADGDPVPFGPVAQAQQRTRMLQPDPVAVPTFAVERGAPRGGGDAIALHIARDADGRLRRLDADVTPVDDSSATDLLLDLSALERPVTALLLDIDAASTGQLDARVTVDGSEDLGSWRTLAAGAAVVSLSEGGFQLERRRVELPVTGLDYLRIRRTDSDGPLPVNAVQVLPAPVEAGLVAPAMQQLQLTGTPQNGDEGVFDFASGGPYPVARVDVALADRNAIANVIVSSRGDADARWRERARFTAFQLAGNGAGVGNADVAIDGVRDRYWRVATAPPQSRAPTLRLAWAPDRFLLLTQGPAPYVLAGGSARAERATYPVRTVLAQLQSQRGEAWEPPQARLGGGSALAGEAALQPPRAPLPVRQLLLWGVLVVGAALLVFMVLRLLRQPPAA